MPHRLRDHTADVAVEATGETLGAAFAATADGLTAAMCPDPPAAGERFDLTVTAESREALLFDYLDRLLYERDVRGVLPADHDCTVRRATDGSDGAAESDGGGDGAAPPDAWTAEASARGVPLAAVTGREVKAVTYSEMAVERRDDGWRIYVVFDV